MKLLQAIDASKDMASKVLAVAGIEVPTGAATVDIFTNLAWATVGTAISSRSPGKFVNLKNSFGTCCPVDFDYED